MNKKDDDQMNEHAFEIHGAARKGAWVVTCDHASNTVPPMVAGGCLGLPASEMARHIAYDIGAAGLSRHLADRLDAPAVLSRFSRLVIDPNRGEDDPTLLMQLYDGTIIPANRRLDAAERARRLDLFYRPYHGAVASVVTPRPVHAPLVAVHSFTPQLRGRAPRPWHVGILYSPRDTRFALPLIERLRRERDLCIGDNEPYVGELAGDSVERHALDHGRPNVLIELRHDLIETEQDQHNWAARLAPILEETRAGLHL